jgi:hypothetical protein
VAAGLTIWNRLEPLDSSSRLDDSLNARIADPLWLLHRQWQLGELDGNDAGSPVAVTVRRVAVPLARYRPDGSAPVEAYDPTVLPLEPVVEAERVRGVAGQQLRLSAEAGAHFLRLLVRAGAGDQVPAYRQAFGLQVPRQGSPEADPLGAEAATLLSGRAVDGDRLADELREARRAQGGVLLELPASFPLGTAAVVAAVATWLAWYEELIVEPRSDEPTPPAWQPPRLEYRFSTGATTAAAATTLAARSYDDGHLDWPDLSADGGEDLGGEVEPLSADHVAVPVPLSYSGMPAHRFWEIEDSHVNFAAVQTTSTDVVRMLLTGFALDYGDDWFMLPLDAPVGSMLTVTKLSVRDTFGHVTEVPPTVDPVGGRRWAMYSLSAGGSDASGALLLPPTLAASLSGPALEEVAFFRDEQANLVWAVERTTASPLGTPVDRYRYGQPVSRVEVDVTDVGDADLVYRLTTPIPTNWHPYLPTATGDGDLRLQRLATRAPQGLIVQESAVLEDEEVSRGGVVVERAWQYARWTDGRPLLWLGRRVQGGRGEGSSGLSWDSTEPVPPRQ